MQATQTATRTCLNCSAPYEHDQSFCPSCGQSTHVHRLTMGHILHEFFHAIFHTDTSIFGIIKHLMIRPGYIARAYVDGKRKSLYNPFNFLVVLVALSILIINLSGVDVFQARNGNPVANLMTKHFNLVIFFTVPLTALYTSLLFRKQEVNFAEAAVLACYTAGERTVFFLVLVIPLMKFFPEHHLAIIWSYLWLYALYFAMACVQFTGQRTVLGFFKGILPTIFLQITLYLLIFLGIYLYHVLK
ncbi:DUF3667 domain-containing protein [Rufibacter aurantiacus]|uniref:DUF3667 domain-containing protein n=1 Tax=Rufibacter aurantiacus TaxID=2817374 RepID=UPI001B30A857|nr:DUF3667 domain-containing protein [Rufibacter aurantiacus]